MTNLTLDYLFKIEGMIIACYLHNHFEIFFDELSFSIIKVIKSWQKDLIHTYNISTMDSYLYWILSINL